MSSGDILEGYVSYEGFEANMRAHFLEFTHAANDLPIIFINADLVEIVQILGDPDGNLIKV